MQPLQQQDSTRPTAAEVLAWDLPTRLFKWSLVACVVAAWATNRFAEERPYLHKWNGYAILVLLVFRVLWGFLGGSTARFSSFVTWPLTAFRFGLDQIRGRDRPYLGHSPIAGWMVLSLMVALFTQASLGLYAADQDRLIIEGPLADTISDDAIHRVSALHRLGFNVILVLAGAHILANVLYALVSRSGYIKAMVTGTKKRAAYIDLAEAKPGSLTMALACLVAALAIVFGAIVGLGGYPRL